MVDIKSGSELDRAVAEAIGWRIDPSRPLDWIGSNGVSVEEFRPSVDLNDAFDAAEAVWLFKDGDHVLRQEASDESWEVARLYSSSEVIVSSEATPALAICAAILELAKVNGT